MASMRKVNRRLTRWHRYARRTYWNPRHTLPRWMIPRSAVACSPGHTRAWDRRERERERRFWDENPEVWLGGPEGEQALIADILDDYRCCTAGDDGHPGPCVTTCSDCWGGGRCPHCGGVDDLGCGECGGSGSCPDCWGQGEHIEDVYIGPVIRTTTAFQEAWLL